MYNFLSEQFFAAALRLKYALTTEDEFDFAGAALTGQTLFVGEGNLSFALCIAKKLGKFSRKAICATTFERSDEWSETTKSNARKLACLGCKVMDGVDAQKIDIQFGTAVFDLVIFQFPNVGSRLPKYGRNPNHILLRRFLKSAANATKAGRQICVTTINSPYYDGSFSIDEAASKAGLAKPLAHRFNPKRFPNYHHVNTSNQDESAIAAADKFVTFVFQKS
jgi:25S rRNA (uracil2634-N3)-methyltransferase